jgi:hypothetical protein
MSGPVWQQASIKKFANELSKEIKVELKPQDVNRRLNTHILEVRIFQGKYAGVIAKEPSSTKKIFDYRSLEWENGRWLNAGNDRFESLEKARRHFSKMCGMFVPRPKRPKITDSETYLKPFVQFLKDNAEEPKTFVMKVLTQYKIVIIGETHHRPVYWSFNSSLIADTDFPKYVGTIYLELPSNNQDLINKFLDSDKCDKKLVIEMLRNNLWMGWPDQPILDFFATVWKINQNLSSDKKLRIILVDMQRPWEKIYKREDWRQYDVDRDEYMANNILRDIQDNPIDKRNRLFIVGVGHTALDFDLSLFEDYPLKTAGWHLKEKLGAKNVYSIMQHRCVMTNMGRVDGRLCLGLFDSSFEKLENRPLAFTLEKGPFGEQMYDGQPDIQVWSKYRDGFNGYLYLGCLEDEIFSPLIPDFYTDDFVEELERRHRLMFGKGWAESYGIKESNVESFVNWMSGTRGSWGRPRKWRNELGPIDAWKYGDDWETEIQNTKHKSALEYSEAIKSNAKKLFDAIRNADYESHQSGYDWQHFLQPVNVDYEVHHDFPGWVQWICKTFKDNPIESVQFGEVSINQNNLPTISYKIVLHDGQELTGDLPFRYIPKQDNWMGVQGLDWHLRN